MLQIYAELENGYSPYLDTWENDAVLILGKWKLCWRQLDFTKSPNGLLIGGQQYLVWMNRKHLIRTPCNYLDANMFELAAAKYWVLFDQPPPTQFLYSPGRKLRLPWSAARAQTARQGPSQRLGSHPVQRRSPDYGQNTLLTCKSLQSSGLPSRLQSPKSVALSRQLQPQPPPPPTQPAIFPLPAVKRQPVKKQPGAQPLQPLTVQFGSFPPVPLRRTPLLPPQSNKSSGPIMRFASTWQKAQHPVTTSAFKLKTQAPLHLPVFQQHLGVPQLGMNRPVPVCCTVQRPFILVSQQQQPPPKPFVRPSAQLPCHQRLQPSCAYR